MDNFSTNKNSLSGMLMLTLCAFIWGTAFIAQSVGGEYAEPLTFNCARSFLATIFLFCCCLLFDKIAGKPFKVLGTDDPLRRDRTIKGGIICGVALSVASFMQQLGIMYTTVGKSGFITALYIVLVPFLNGGGQSCRTTANNNYIIQILLFHYSIPTKSRLGFSVSAPGCHLAGQTSSPCSATN